MLSNTTLKLRVIHGDDRVGSEFNVAILHSVFSLNSPWRSRSNSTISCFGSNSLTSTKNFVAADSFRAGNNALRKRGYNTLFRLPAACGQLLALGQAAHIDAHHRLTQILAYFGQNFGVSVMRGCFHNRLGPFGRIAALEDT